MARVEYALLATLAALRLTKVLPCVSIGYVFLCQSYACRVYCCYVKALKAHLLLFCMPAVTTYKLMYPRDPPRPSIYLQLQAKAPRSLALAYYTTLHRYTRDPKAPRVYIGSHEDDTRNQGATYVYRCSFGQVCGCLRVLLGHT